MPNGRFYGRVVDASNKGVEAASVVLVTMKMDTVTKQRKEAVVGGQLTAANGDFSIENVPVMGQYTLRITGIGYTTFEQKVQFERPKGGGDPNAMINAIDKDLGNLKLTINQQELSNVTVTAQRPQLTLGIDRKVFNVDRNITSAGGTAVDVMRNVPSVAVDVEGNVTLRNNAPTIFVDGRPTVLTLEQIPADAIETIEIITNPSAKFDASGGTAGILNIVLKKQRRAGYAGNIRASVDSRLRGTVGADVNVRQGKVNVFASANVMQRKSIGSGITDRRSTGTLINSNLHQEDSSTMQGTFGFGRLGMDYFLNNRNTITVSGNFGKRNMTNVTETDIFTDKHYNVPNTDTSTLQPRYTDGRNWGQNGGAQVSFKHNFPKAGHELTADVNYNKGTNSNESVITTQTYRTYPDQKRLDDYVQSQRISGDNRFIVAQADYANPLSDKAKVEGGVRMQIRDLVSDITYVRPENTTNTYYTNQERVYAVYGNYSGKAKNFGYQLGLRAESSTNEGILNRKQSFRTEYPVSLFPSVFLSQKLNDYNDLQLNFSRRINRPNFFQLFPFTDYTDTLNISRGNPGLVPEFTNSVELSYAHQSKNRDNFIASLYFKNTNNLITQIQQPEFDTFLKRDVFVNTFINANRSWVSGLELVSRNKIASFWDLTSNLNLFTSQVKVTGITPQDPFVSYFVKINNQFRLPKNFSIQLSGDYTSKIVAGPGGSNSGGGGGRGGFGGMGGGGGSTAQGYIRPNYGVDMAVRYEFLKERKASLGLNMNDIFRTRKYDSYTATAGFEQNIVRRRDPQILRLTFSYRFGKMDATLFKRKNTRTEDGGMDAGM
ncbi:TonB-dependent receptor [Flaviaesturariibacter flavus]|uniref:TonB-dependent receptor n=2 Tax=Flaviaesturariibacter flavus TaxID=2502780 RepID=A0A4R1BP19_9BACT|nr:TonB-dependent receptor [Flaviaesturariibacter flavus]